MNKEKNLLIIIMFVLLVLSTLYLYIKYIVYRDVSFFTEADNIPGSFDGFRNIFGI